MDKKRRDIVRAVLIREAKVLLLETAGNGQVFELPGGEVRKKADGFRMTETTESALIRVAREILGISVRNERLVGVFQVEPPSSGSRWLYLCSFVGVPLIRDPSKFMRMLWATRQEIQEFICLGLLAPGTEHVTQLL